jgi:hypothetical protein
MFRSPFWRATALSVILLGCQAKAPEKEPEAEKPAPQAFPAAQARLTRTYVCSGQVTAYDPSHPSQILGHFKPGSELRISDSATAPGMVLVSYQDPSGPMITALCKADDVGQTTSQPATPSPPPEQAANKPKGLVSSRPAETNPKYKPLGGGR